MRVLQIVESMNMGGSQNFIMNVYRNICKDKIQFDFLTHREGIFDDEIRKLGGKIFQLDYLTKIGPVNYKKQLENFFKNHPEYDTIHVHLNQVSGIVLEVAKKQNIPNRIVHSHSTKNMNSFIVKIYKKYLQSKINKNATMRLACSKEAGKWLYKNEKFTVIPNGIEMQKFRFDEISRNKIRKELNIPMETIVVGNVARFDLPKNHLFLIDIFEEYLKLVDDAILILVGDGSLKEKIKLKIRDKGIEDKVKFIGIKKDVEKYYSAFDFFVLPSLYEGLGIVLIEAQASGLKSYTSKQKVPEEAKISDYLKYIPLGENAKQWAQEIEKSNIYERKDINLSDNYDISKITKRIEKIYQGEKNE